MHHSSKVSPQQTSEFIRLLTHNQTAIRGFITSLLPGSNDVADVMQETNIVLWEKMSTFKADSNFSAWAFTIARFKVLQYHEKRKKSQCIVFSQDILDSVAAAQESTTPEHVEQQLRALGICVSMLKNSEQQHIQARYTGKLNIDEYAQMEGRSRASLRVTLHRIRQKLRTCIAKRLAEGGAV